MSLFDENVPFSEQLKKQSGNAVGDLLHEDRVIVSDSTSGLARFCIQGNEIYSGTMPMGNPVFVVEGKHIYAGPMPMGNPLFTIGDDHRIYVGSYACGECVGRIADGQIFLGGYYSSYSAFRF